MLQPTKGQKILEIGCGPAVTAHQLIEKYGTFVDAIDLSEFQLKRAREFNSQYVADGRLELIKGDIAEATLPIGRYDAGFGEAVFFHLSQKEKALQNIRAALRPNARFVFDDLILMKPAKTCDLNKAFRRFGNLKFDTEPHYTEVLQDTGFRTVEAVPVTEDVARTYLKLLANLEEQQFYSDSPFSGSLYTSLRSSFHEIVGLLRDGQMAARLFVATAI